MSYSTLILERRDGVLSITLNRPHVLNALDVQMRLDLESALADIRKDDNVRTLVITGAGRAFCAGGDINMMHEAAGWTPHEMLEDTRLDARVVRDLWELEKPVIMAVNGHAVGAGTNLALCGDIIIASEQARFGEFFIRRGVAPNYGGLYFLPRLVGYLKATELCMTGDLIDAQEAFRIGLVNLVVPHEELMSTAKGLAEKLAKGPPLALATCKALLRRGLHEDFRGFLECEALFQAHAVLTEDHREAVRAFLERRDPVFKGK